MTLTQPPPATPDNTLTPARAETVSRGWPPLVLIASGCLGGFAMAAIVAGLLNPGYSQVRDTISPLAATDAHAAWVMIAGFMSAALALGCTGLAIWHRFAGRASGRIAAVLTGLGGAGMVVAGLAREDCSEAQPTCIDRDPAILASDHYWVHQYTSLALFVLLVVALFALARAQRRSEGWAYLAVPSRIAAGVCAALLVQMVIAEPGAYSGLIQRLFVLLLFGWPVLAAGLPSRPAALAARS